MATVLAAGPACQCGDGTDLGPHDTGASGPVDAGFFPDAEAWPDAEPVPDGGATLDGGTTVDAGAECPPNRSTVRGSVTRTHFAAAGTTSEPVDVTGYAYAALVQRADGTFETIPGTAGPGGRFTIPCVPEVRYLLEERRAGGAVVFLLDTTDRTVEREELTLGRAGATEPSPGTALDLDLDGLEPWTDEHGLLLWTTHGPVGLPDATPGATELRTRAPYEPSDGPPRRRLVDAAEGDRAAVIQTRSTTTAAGRIRRVVRVLRVPGLTMRDGQATPIRGTLGLPNTRTVAIDWRVGEFVGHDRQANRSDLITLSVESLPAGARTARFPLLSRSLVSLSDTSTTGAISAVLPVPLMDLDDRLVLGVTDTKLVSNRARLGDVLLSVPLGGSSTDPTVVRPSIAPPARARVDGRDATRPLSGLGPTPTVTWDAPATGEAHHYTLHLWADPNDYVAFRVETSRRRFTFPPGLFAPGVLEIMAHSHPADDAIPSGSASVFTAHISP